MRTKSWTGPVNCGTVLVLYLVERKNYVRVRWNPLKMPEFEVYLFLYLNENTTRKQLT